jgi:dephospho-CoA kinase
MRHRPGYEGVHPAGARPVTPGSPGDAQASTVIGGSRLRFVALTGGLGAGKSTALAAFERLGAATISTDAIVHELYESDEVRRAVVERWGRSVAPGGTVDRAEIAKHVFADPDERRWLEGTIWPLVGRRLWDWRQEVGRLDPPPRAAVVEIPLLFESGMESAYDAAVAIVAPEEVRAERAGSRGHAAVDERASAQLSQEEKARRATYTVVNDGTVEELEAKLSDVLDEVAG